MCIFLKQSSAPHFCIENAFVFKVERLRGEICESPERKHLGNYSPGKTVGAEQKVQFFLISHF